MDIQYYFTRLMLSAISGDVHVRDLRPTWAKSNAAIFKKHLRRKNHQGSHEKAPRW
jgi:hypothetical protein